MTDSALAEPGILLRMVSEEPPHRAPGAALPATAAKQAVIVAAACAWTGTWFVVDAARTGLQATQLDAARWSEWLPFAVTAGLGVVVASLRDRRLPALMAMSALVGSAIAGAGGEERVRVGLHAFGLFAAAGLCARAGARTRVVALAQAVATAAAAALALFAAAPLAAWCGAGAIGMGSLVLSFAIAARPFARAADGAVEPAPDRLSVAARRLLTVGVVTAILWAATPASLWRGLPLPDRAVFVAAAAASLWGLLAQRQVAAIVFAGLAFLGSMTVAAAPARLDPDLHRALASERTTVAAYERSSQSMLWFADGELVDAAGGENVGAELAATVLACLRRPGDRVLVLGEGTGRVPAALLRTGVHEVEVVDGGPCSDALRTAMALDGPVMPPVADAVPPGVRRRSAGWRSTIEQLPAASRQVVIVAESPSAATAEQATPEVQRQLRRVVGDGLVLQALALDHTPAQRVQELLLAAATEHPWNGVFAVGGAAWLLSAGSPPAWPAADAFVRWSAEARWTAHAAHLGDLADVQRALLGSLRGLPTAAAPSPEPGTVAVVLRESLQPVPVQEPPETGSSLLRWLGRRADLRAAAEAIAGLGADVVDVQRAQAIAAGFLHLGAPSACLQAALGLPDAAGVSLVDPEAACLRAHAIDPTFFRALPPVLQSLPRPRAERGELEDFARLPEPGRLAELCSGDTPLAIALRARFASRCARALVEALARGGLPQPAVEALRELADPFVLAEAARSLQGRAALPELLALWRADLPMPAAIKALAAGDVAQRRVLAAALGGRRDIGSVGLLADLLAAPEVQVRRVAAESLRATCGDLLPYDPEGPRSALIEAADRLRSLHNRKP